MPDVGRNDARIEVDQQTNRTTGKFQVRDYLRAVNWGQFGDGFDFDQHRLLDYAGGLETRIERVAAINKRYRSIAFNFKPVGLELEHQGAVVDRFD
jgi:hypothetical protein